MIFFYNSFWTIKEKMRGSLFRVGKKPTRGKKLSLFCACGHTMDSFGVKRARASNEHFYEGMKNPTTKRAFVAHLKKQGMSGLMDFLESSNEYEERYPDIASSCQAQNENQLRLQMKLQELKQLSKLYEKLESQEIGRKLQLDENSAKRLIGMGHRVKSCQKLLKLTGAHDSVSIGEIGLLNDKLFFVNRQVEKVLMHYFAQFKEKLQLYGIRKTESAPTPRNSPEAVTSQLFAIENELFRSISANSDGKGFPVVADSSEED